MPEIILKIIVNAVPILFAITVHEVAHGWIASKLGDQTARMMGRLTLNPIKHIDPVGTILVPAIMLLTTPFLFGWAKPVPGDWRNLRRPRQDMAWVALAGPGANLLMLILWTLAAKLVLIAGMDNTTPGVLIMAMALVGILINAILMFFNLVPIPPLDGSRVMAALLPPKAAYKYGKLEPFGLIIVLVLLFIFWSDFFRVVNLLNTYVNRFLFL